MFVLMTTEHSGGGDVNKSLELLWDMQEKPTRGPKPGLTLTQIVEAAVAVADAEGLAAVSMRRVATELGVGTMSLYRYVPGKAELLDLMLDHVAGPVDSEPEPLPLREALERLGRGIWKLCLDHPWYSKVDQARPLLGPNNVGSMNSILTQLKPSGLPDKVLVMMVAVVEGFVVAVARTQVNGIEAEKRTGISEDEFWAAQEPVLVKMMETGRYPALAAADADTFTFGYEEVMEFGLQALLDGLERYVTT